MRYLPSSPFLVPQTLTPSLASAPGSGQEDHGDLFPTWLPGQGTSEQVPAPLLPAWPAHLLPSKQELGCLG